jgi:hypothetical protein
LETSSADFVHVAQDYLGSLVTSDYVPADIHVQLLWDRALPPVPALERVGRRVWLGEGRMRFSEIRLVPGLQMDVLWDQEILRIRAAYRWPDRRTRWLAKLSEPLRMRTYLSLIYYLVYFPWGWWLERNRGWILVHAAGLTHAKDGIVVAGLPGCGKSTFAWAALSRPNWRVLSDNLLFTDGEQIWAFPEPLHVDQHAQQLGGGVSDQVHATGHAFSHQREEFGIDPSRRANSARASHVLFLRRGQHHRVRSMQFAPAFRRLWANDFLAQEWRAYQISSAALQHLVPEIGDPKMRWASLSRLSHLPCYEVIVAENKALPESFYQMLEAKKIETEEVLLA